jgi:large subunit ribosomal protein L2
VRALSCRFRNMSGRNTNGRVVCFTKGSRVRKRLRIIDNAKHIYNVPGNIVRIEYDPNRSAFIALILYANGICCYSVHTNGTAIGDALVSYLDLAASSVDGLSVYFRNGDSSILRCIPQGTVIHNVELYPGSGGSIARGAGSFCLLLRKYMNIRKCLVVMPSKKQLTLSMFCNATKGLVGNTSHKRVMLGNAGRARRLGKKPVVRGVAMNPVDHPHGGGEGKKSKKCFPRTAWGKMLHWRRTGISLISG